MDHRLTNADILLTVTRRGDRLTVAWDGDAFHLVRASFRVAFPTARYDPHGKCWHLPTAMRPRLVLWVRTLFDPAAVHWQPDTTTTPPASAARGGRGPPAQLDHKLHFDCTRRKDSNEWSILGRPRADRPREEPNRCTMPNLPVVA